MARAPRSLALLLLGALAAASAATAAAPPPAALDLRARGIAQLENEQPAEAEKTFAELTRAVPGDPLGWANRAVAALRQQQIPQAVGFVDRALSLAPGRPDLLAIKGDVLQWSGRPEAALPLYRQAAEEAPGDLEIVHGLLRMAEMTSGGDSAAARSWALERLAALRPDNLVVMLQLGREAVERGDRAAASRAALRVRELLWQAPPVAETALAALLAALEQGELDRARVGMVRLENVLKVTPMYQQGLRELTTGLQGNPVLRFVSEPPPADFGPPVAVAWRERPLGSTAATALGLGDWDGDGRADLAVAFAGSAPQVELRLAARSLAAGRSVAAPGVGRLRAADLDNDGHWDLLAAGRGGLRAWRGAGVGGLADVTGEWGLDGAAGRVLTVLDHDIEGDLDLAVGGGSRAVELFRNALPGALEAVGARALPRLAGVAADEVSDLVASDLDGDGDLDLLVVHAAGLTLLDNLRQGRFADATSSCGLRREGGPTRAVAADLDGDGRMDLVTAGERLVVWRNRGDGGFEVRAIDLDLPAAASALVAFDADNDGRLDLAAATAKGVAVFRQKVDGSFERTVVGSAPVADLVAADFDADGDLDLATAGPGGLAWLENEGGSRNHWLALRLQGLTRGNSKNNSQGLGAVVEVRSGRAFQRREADGPVTHLGLGRLAAAGVLRVVWTNGVPQNRLAVRGDQLLVEEQLLKGSCPFLYAWDGEVVAFVTDLLWGAPIGLPVAEGVWAGADPSELVAVPGARPREDGSWDLRVTEELWEAAYLDHLRLWVVDHPEEVEVASNLRVVPGRALPEEVRATRDVRPVAAAWDGGGSEVTERVARRDEVYADGYRPSAYQGVAAEPWRFTFDLGAAPTAPVRLLLDGWIFPADASLNLAVDQRRDLEQVATRLEVETAEGWRPLLDPMGFPAGKTKTMVIDTPPLPEGARRLRIVTSQWLHWDRVAWSPAPADGEAEVVARLLPATAELAWRGFSRPVREAPNAPHVYDYSMVSADSPWLPFPGHYTRYGDVRELLAAADDRTVILAPGDELRLLFDGAGLPAPRPGHRRTVFLESHGWDKDADRNTWAASGVEPLPFRAMSGYPYGEGEEYPAELEPYREEWLTRQVPAAAPR